MKTQFVTDNNGKRVSVILSIKEYRKILDDLEVLEDIKTYDRAKRKKSNAIPLEIALKELGLYRNGNGRL